MAQPYTLADDVSAASAAYLLNLLPSILELPAPEAFEQLKDHFHAALIAFSDGMAGWMLDPSEN